MTTATATKTRQKTLLGRFTNPQKHWVGDGFPVASLFSYNRFGQHISPFLLLDHGGPAWFDPSPKQRGVGQHPHRGFETVTIVFDGEVSHRDSAGNGGTIGKDEVQWMTAAGGIIHEEFHSEAFGKSGGLFHMAQLWVNLPAKDKMTAPSYQGITRDAIREASLANDSGRVRVIAGDFAGTEGPARTHTPINVWDMRLNAGGEAILLLPDGHTTMLVVLSGRVSVNGGDTNNAPEVFLLSREGSEAHVRAESDAIVLTLTGEPIEEPIVGYGPFVMNTQSEIRQAIEDFNSGRFGAIPT
ncbi:MAG: pirin family protein [Hyphomonadaceae bacterium]